MQGQRTTLVARYWEQDARAKGEARANRNTRGRNPETGSKAPGPDNLAPWVKGGASAAAERGPTQL